VGRIPTLPRLHLGRCPGKNPGGVTHHKVLVTVVVYRDLSNTEIEKECRLLKEQIVCVPVRRVVELVDADNIWMIVFVNGLQKQRIVSMPRPERLDVIPQFCALRDCIVSAELSGGSSQR